MTFFIQIPTPLAEWLTAEKEWHELLEYKPNYTIPTSDEEESQYNSNVCANNQDYSSTENVIEDVALNIPTHRRSFSQSSSDDSSSSSPKNPRKKMV